MYTTGFKDGYFLRLLHRRIEIGGQIQVKRLRLQEILRHEFGSSCYTRRVQGLVGLEKRIRRESEISTKDNNSVAGRVERKALH